MEKRIKLETWFLVCFNHEDRESKALWQYTGWDFLMLMDASASLQCASQQVPLTEPLCHPALHGIWRDYCSLPCCLITPGMVQCLSPGAVLWQPSAHFANSLRVSSKSHLRLKTKQQRLDFFLFPCQQLHIPCQDVTCNTLHYRHTSLMLTQSRETLTALSHVTSGLMHQGKALALW